MMKNAMLARIGLSRHAGQRRPGKADRARIWIAGHAIALLMASAPTGACADPIDDYVQAQMVRQHVPGLAVAIVQRGRIVRAQGYGLANLELSVPVHPDTLFKSGAVGMQFTAAATMLLVEDGKIGLDDPVRRFLPNAPQSWAPITVRQLLNHTSGLPATPNGEFRTDYTDDELLGIIYKQDLNFPAGLRWRFSYTDYIVLGFIIKKVTGEPYTGLLAKRLFAPLGMRTARPIDELAIVPNRAAGYEWREGRLRNAEWVSPTANSTADGTLYLSALDYAAWAAALSSRAALKPASWAAIAQPARLLSGRTYHYGFGWFLGRGKGQDVWRHSGNWQGFRTSIIHYLSDEMTVIVLLNADSGDPDIIARHVAALVDPKLAGPPAVPIAYREPQLGPRLKDLLQRIATGTPDYGDFAYVSKLDFTDMITEDRTILRTLGSLREIALFDRGQSGDDSTYRYRARYDAGVVEISLGYAPNGKIGSFDLALVEDWNAPLQ